MPLGRGRVSNLQTARELDQLKGRKLLNKLLLEHAERVKAIEADTARRGYGLSGMKGHAIWKSHAQRLEEYIDGRITIRRELVPQSPELGSAAELVKLLGELEQHIASFEKARLQPGNDSMPPVVEQKNQTAYRLRAHARLEIEMLKREIAIKPPPAREQAAIVTVTTGGGPAIVNLGTVYGSVQQVIGNLNESSPGELAELLGKLADAIQQATALGDERRIYLEQVRFIAEQASAAADAQQASVVGAVFGSLRARLQDVANVAQILALAGPAIARHFGIPWPF